MVDTNIAVDHNPILYPEEAVNLVVAAESTEFISDYGTYDGSIPVELDSQVEIQVTGVTDRDMTPDEIQVFENVVFRFLQDSLISGDAAPPIFVQNATLLQQTVAAPPAAAPPSPSGSSSNSDPGLSRSSVLTAVVNVTGEYLPPPPDLVFEEVVIEAFNDDSGEEFTESLQESNTQYFSEVSSSKASTVYTDDGGGGGEDDAFGPLGVAGGVSIIILALVAAVVGGFFVFWKKRGKESWTRNMKMRRASMGDVPVPMMVAEEKHIEVEAMRPASVVGSSGPPRSSLVSTTVEEFVQSDRGVERTSVTTTTHT